MHGPKATSTVPQKTLWTRQVTDSEDVPVGPPDSTQPGNLDPKTAALQQSALSRLQLSQGSQESHAGHGKWAGTGITHRLHTSEGVQALILR